MRRIETTIRRSLFAVVLLVFASFSAVLEAQNYDNPGLGELPVYAHPQDYKPLGIRAGGFMLHPGVQLAAEYNQNIYYTSENNTSDKIWHVRPYIAARSNWNRHALEVRLAADVARYADNGDSDYEDYMLYVNGRVDVRNRSALSYSMDYKDLHEDLSFRGAEQGRVPTRYNVVGGSLAYDQTFNRLSIGVLADLRRSNYDNSVAVDGSVLDNQDRDRDDLGVSLRLGYQFQTDKQAFVSYQIHKSDFKQALDRNDINRNSSGLSADAGLKFNVTGKLDGDVFVTYHDESYDDPMLPNVNGWAGGAAMQWRPTKLTSIGARITSDIQPTTYGYSSGYLRTLYTVRADHELLRDLQINGQVSYSDSKYQLTADAPVAARSKDEVWQYGLGLSYFVNRYIFLSAAYTEDRAKSNLPNDDYTVRRIWLTLSLER